MDKTEDRKQKIEVRSYKLGKFRFSLLSGGRFWLDGGAMFGVVPKPLWEKSNPSDSRNRIELSLNCLLVETGDKNVLIDTGIWEGGNDKFNEIYKIDYRSVEEALRVVNLVPQDIDVVINSHLHFDHCGGNTKAQDTRYVPSFPCAKYVVQEIEWYDAIHSNERTRSSYIPETFIPLEESGNLHLINGDTEILPGVRVYVTGGHTRGHQVVFLESEGEKVIYLADLVPTTSHIKTPYIMGYDLYPIDTLNKKRMLLEMALNEHWLLVFEHDPQIGMGYLDKNWNIRAKEEEK